MKITKKQRNEVYRAMLKYALKDPNVNYGFCNLLTEIYWADKRVYKKSLISRDLFYSYRNICDFTELIKYEPNTHFGYWFACTTEGWEKRIEILQKCIKQTS